jgi:hypothetical protein
LHFLLLSNQLSQNALRKKQWLVFQVLAAEGTKREAVHVFVVCVRRKGITDAEFETYVLYVTGDI